MEEEQEEVGKCRRIVVVEGEERMMPRGAF